LRTYLRFCIEADGQILLQHLRTLNLKDMETIKNSALRLVSPDFFKGSNPNPVAPEQTDSTVKSFP
jgi:hypothetical protein